MFFSSNPFAELATLISPSVMQAYVVLMVLLVIAGTLLDIWHKQSARYFFENARKAERNAKRPVSSSAKMSSRGVGNTASMGRSGRIALSLATSSAPAVLAPV